MADTATNNDTLSFIAFGDWGNAGTEQNLVASAMDNWAKTNKASFVLALGDNFYPGGVVDVQDKLWKTFWSDPFLKYESLRVPWHVVLGNHDYNGNPQAQIDFTTSQLNPYGGVWHMPAKNYKFSHTLKSGVTVDFFAFDTNGAQYSVRTIFPKVEQELHQLKKWLSDELAASKATWKIVMAHHPLFTKSTLHGTIGRCLRDATYKHKRGVSEGFSLEEVFVKGGVDAYFSGHEHLFQYHESRGVHHFVCGSTGVEGGVGFYGGEDVSQEMTWFDSARKYYGFVGATLNNDNTLDVTFYDAPTRAQIHKVTIKKRNT